MYPKKRIGGLAAAGRLKLFQRYGPKSSATLRSKRALSASVPRPSRTALETRFKTQDGDTPAQSAMDATLQCFKKNLSSFRLVSKLGLPDFVSTINRKQVLVLIIGSESHVRLLLLTVKNCFDMCLPSTCRRTDVYS